MDAPFLTTLADILRNTAIVLLYFVVGFGPGFCIGVLLANKYVGKDHQLRMDKHNENIQKAGQHNSQWHPDNPRWKE